MNKLLAVGAIMVTAAVGRVFASRLERRTKRAIDGPAPVGQRSGENVLAIFSGYWILFAGASATAVLFLAGTLISGDVRLRWLGPAVSLLSGAGGLFLFRELRLRISLDDEGLSSRGTWRRSARIRWSEITAVVWNPTLTSFVFRNSAGDTVRVPMLVRGIGTLRKQLREKVAEGIWRDAFAKYDQAMGPSLRRT
jgi:hypothetical protein